MSPVSNKPSETSALPPEFSHKALQSLVRKGSTTGSLTGAEVAEAMRAADVRAARGRVVLRALGEQGITVAMDSSSTGVAAATSTAKKTVASSRTTSGTAAKPIIIKAQQPGTVVVDGLDTLTGLPSKSYLLRPASSSGRFIWVSGITFRNAANASGGHNAAVAFGTAE